MSELVLTIPDHIDNNNKGIKTSGGYIPLTRKVNNYNQWHNGYIPAMLKKIRLG